jgi:hypothetical protein
VSVERHRRRCGRDAHARRRTRVELVGKKSRAAARCGRKGLSVTLYVGRCAVVMVALGRAPGRGS